MKPKVEFNVRQPTPPKLIVLHSAIKHLRDAHTYLGYLAPKVKNMGEIQDSIELIAEDLEEFWRKHYE